MMNSLADLKNILLHNKLTLILLIALSVVSSIVHYNLQTQKYTSSLMTTNGKYDSPYLSVMIQFKELDTSFFTLSENQLEHHNELLQDIKISPLVGSGKFIKLNLVSAIDNTNKKQSIQATILDLLNHNRQILAFREKILEPAEISLDYINGELQNYQTAKDSLNLSVSSKKYIRIEKRIYTLQKEKTELENKFNTIGQFFYFISNKRLQSF